jgi:uncharacterized protein YwqG
MFRGYSRQMTPTSYEQRARAVLERYCSPAVLLHRPYPPQSVLVGQSFFGGLPTLPDGCEWPRTDAGIPLHFFCQVDCAEISWRTSLPDHGVLFFFGRDDAEQLWGVGAAQDDCRVIYIPDGSKAERATEPPFDLPPIGWDYPRSSFRDVALEGEMPRRVHVKWPAQPLPMDSFPDIGGLPSLVAHHNRTGRRFQRAYSARKFLRRIFPQVRAFPRMVGESPDRSIWDRYDELLPLFRARAFEEATGQNTYEDPLLLGLYDGTRRMFGDDAFPQYWVFIHFFARAALRRHRSTGVFDYPALTPEELRERAKADAQLDAEAMAWFIRSCAAPLDTRPGDAERCEFRAWAAGIERRAGEPGPSFRALEWARAAAIWAVREWAGDRALAVRLPSTAYECVADEFHLSSVQRGEDKDWYDFSFSQMLGHAPAAQEAKAADDPDICLLNIASDKGLGWSFGDAGECSFWITPADLAACDFSRVRGTIEGH